MKTFIEQFEAINFHRLISLNRAECLKVEKLHKQLFNKSAQTKNGCKSCYQDAYFKIKNHLKITTMSKFELKSNALLDFANNPIKGVPIHVTNANLTDVIAKKILARSMNYSKFFERMPEEAENQENSQISTSVNASKAIEAISEMQDADDVASYVEGDERKTVLSAAKERIEQLNEHEGTHSNN